MEAMNEKPKYQEKRLDLPNQIRLMPADAMEVETLERFDREGMVEYYGDAPDELCSWIYHPDANGEMKAVKVCRTASINGILYCIYPGKNLIPKAVKEFLDQQDAQAMTGRRDNQRLQQSMLLADMGRLRVD